MLTRANFAFWAKGNGSASQYLALALLPHQRKTRKNKHDEQRTTDSLDLLAEQAERGAVKIKTGGVLHRRGEMCTTRHAKTSLRWLIGIFDLAFFFDRYSHAKLLTK